MATTATSVSDICLAAKRASRELAMLGSSVKDGELEAIAAALCLKSGNAIVLRGSSSAAHSNAVLAGVAAAAAVDAGLPEGALSLVAGGGRDELSELATQTGVVDLIIPRGGEGLKAALKGVATVPVIYAASGNCHVFVDASADADAAQAIVLNAKLQRPGVCNAAETLLVHA